MKSLKALVANKRTSEDDKVKSLHEALLQQIEDTKALEEARACMVRRLEDVSKESSRCSTEVSRNSIAKGTLEASCRELQGKKATIVRENQQIADDERNRHAELKAKFQQAMKDVQEKMGAELQVRQHFLKENEELRGKLQKFTEAYQEQEQHLTEQRDARGREIEAAQKRLEEYEQAAAASKIKSANLEKNNEVMRKSQVVLRAELQSILGRFDEFHDSVTGSNQRHGECKTEIDDLQSRVQDLESENADLRTNASLTEMQQEQQVAQKQLDALAKLCSNLQKENKQLMASLQDHRKGRKSVGGA